MVATRHDLSISHNARILVTDQHSYERRVVRILNDLEIEKGDFAEDWDDRFGRYYAE